MSASLWLVPLSYLCGSIPFGLLIAKVSTGADVRRIGSGNIGATNVLRAAGELEAALTLVLDMLKGWAPVTLGHTLGLPEPQIASVGMVAFLGHLYPVFLGFRGGKGVATFLGVLLAIAPKAAVLVVAIWLFIAALFRYSSLAAIIASAASPPLVWWLAGRLPYVVLMAIMFGFILVRHRDNMRRLMAGEEGRIGGSPHGV